MSNEELVKLIQNGENEYISELWENVELFVRKQANSCARQLAGRYGVDADDLYQAGFIAVFNAAKSHDVEQGKFITWLALHLKNAFAEAAGYRTERESHDPLNVAVSLDAPIGNGDGSDMIRAELVPDTHDCFAAVEREIYNQQLHAALENVLVTIPAKDAEVLREHYFKGWPVEDIAEKQGVSSEAISTRKRRGLQNMRQKVNTSQGVALRGFLEERTPYYARVGPKRFNVTHTSAVEFAVLERERMAGGAKQEDALINAWRGGGGVWRA